MRSESRIWEIRPFGSMRGGRELVIGLCAFQSSISCLLYAPAQCQTVFPGLKKLVTFQPFPVWKRVEGARMDDSFETVKQKPNGQIGQKTERSKHEKSAIPN